MGRSLVFGACMCAILLVAASMRSDVAADTTTSTSSTVASPEPITGTAVQPAAGSSWRTHQPFTPYDVGPYQIGPSNGVSPKPLWAYEDLTPAERAVADRGRDTTGWAPVHDAYAAATAERAKKAAADSAQSQLGAENLGAIGVVP